MSEKQGKKEESQKLYDVYCKLLECGGELQDIIDHHSTSKKVKKAFNPIIEVLEKLRHQVKREGWVFKRYEKRKRKRLDKKD